MNIRFATEDEIAQWDELVLRNPDGGNVLQGALFATQKGSSGWRPRFVIANDTIAILVLERPVFGFGKVWYIPKGPGVSTPLELQDVAKKLKDLAGKNGVFVVKIEPELPIEGGIDETLFTPAASIQPSATVVLDLHASLDDILLQFGQKARHAIRRATRDGVRVERVEATEENCRTMFSLLRTTAAGKFPTRGYEYYRRFWQDYSAADQGQLFFSYVDNQLVAAAFALIFGHKSIYKDGASVRERPVYGASHLTQWDVIAWAKAKGSVTHDLYGVPPAHRSNDTHHSLYGVGLFKRSFNKNVVEYVGVLDIPVRSFRYCVWKTIGARVVLGVYFRVAHHNFF